MQTKTQIRKSVSRGKFTTEDFATAAEVTKATARRRLASLVEQGIVERLDETAKVTNKAGDQRGRPRHQFRVAKGK